MNNKITKAGDLENLQKGEVVELPPFSDDIPFTARVKRPSLLTLCKIGAVPNTLLNAARKMFEGEKIGDIKEYGEVLNIVAEKTLIEPAYEDIKYNLTDEQLTAIWNYMQYGVTALLPFRKLREKRKELAKNSNNSKGK